MTSAAKARTAQVTIRIAIGAICFVGATLLSFSLVRAMQRPKIWTSRVPKLATNDTITRVPFKSGRYLIAYVIVSSECGFCAEPKVRTAIGHIRDSLALHRGVFAGVSVIGVVIDRSLASAAKYVGAMGRDTAAFDQLIVGGGWLNEQLVHLVWRDGIAVAATPQVVLVERQVDMADYPQKIEIGRDSTVLKLIGRDEVLDWVAAGVPLQFERSGDAARSP